MIRVSYLVFIAVAAVVTWWLSGYDTAVTGEDVRADYVRRATRCGITLVLLTVALTSGGYFALYIFVGIAVIWASCGAEFWARQFHKLIDPEDDRPFDPKEVQRKLDQLGEMVQQGHTGDALEFCKQLEESGQVSALMLEATYHRLYQESLASAERSPFLAGIQRFREHKEFGHAESQLKELLTRQPDNWGALLLLMRLYAEDLSQPQKALALLQPDPKQPQLPSAFLKYARDSIAQWSSRAKTNEPPPSDQSAAAPPPASEAAVVEISVDELLKTGQLATAIEHLENAIKQEPQDIELWLKLAEAHAVYCADFNRAAKIIRKLEFNPSFTPEQITLANSKLKEWRTRRGP